MKTLSRFVVLVTNTAQLEAATKFYQRATRRRVNPHAARTVGEGEKFYVGMFCDRTVLASRSKYDREEIVEFADMDTLADTTPRLLALKASGWQPTRRKTETRPLVCFQYPSSQSLMRTVRNVRLIKADANYYIGLEILPDNQFKFKKFLKTKATGFEVIEF